MRQSSVDDLLKLCDRFGVELDFGKAVDVGGAPSVYMSAPCPNPLLELHSNVTFLDNTQETAHQVMDFLDYQAIVPHLWTYDRVFSFDTLEHCANPFLFADHLIAVTKPGGYIYVATVFNWHYHPNPEDYWRFSPAGLRECFTSEWVVRAGEFDVMWSDWGSHEHSMGVCLFGQKKSTEEINDVTTGATKEEETP